MRSSLWSQSVYIFHHWSLAFLAITKQTKKKQTQNFWLLFYYLNFVIGISHHPYLTSLHFSSYADSCHFISVPVCLVFLNPFKIFFYFPLCRLCLLITTKSYLANILTHWSSEIHRLPKDIHLTTQIIKQFISPRGVRIQWRGRQRVWHIFATS